MKNLFLTTSSMHKRRGVTLLIAVLISAVVLAVGLGIYQRTYKELLFASFWQQTQQAFVAADGGLECALYWDLHPSATPSCFNNTITTWVAAATGATYTDAGGWNFYAVTYTPNTDLVPRCSCDTGGGWECSTPTFTGTDVGPTCYDWFDNAPNGWMGEVFNRTATGGASGMPSGNFQLNTYGGCVSVTITKPAPSGASTLIEARGYNDACGSTNPRRVERGLNIEY